jgi:AraC family transcriptional regulator
MESTPVSVRPAAFQAPIRYLSSDGLGWDSLLAEAFYEPPALEGWLAPDTSDISLILFSGGALQIDQRPLNGSWRTARLDEGDLILRAGQGGSAEVRWFSLSGAPTETLHLHLGRSMLNATAAALTSRDPSRLSLVGRTGFQDPLLVQIGLSLWQELRQQTAADSLYAQTAAQMLTVHLLRHYAKAQIREVTGRLSVHQIERITSYVTAHLAQELSLDTLAEQLGFSPYHFARLFRQTTGETPHQFVTRQRLNRAKQMLRETTLPVAYIALESGFANQSHLTRVFRQQIGLTPHDYRRNA